MNIYYELIPSAPVSKKHELNMVSHTSNKQLFYFRWNADEVRVHLFTSISRGLPALRVKTKVITVSGEMVNSPSYSTLCRPGTWVMTTTWCVIVLCVIVKHWVIVLLI